jgi:hypothetical protein
VGLLPRALPLALSPTSFTPSLPPKVYTSHEYNFMKNHSERNNREHFSIMKGLKHGKSKIKEHKIGLADIVIKTFIISDIFNRVRPIL